VIGKLILSVMVFGAFMAPSSALPQALIRFPGHPAAPKFELSALNGEAVSLEDLQGTPVLLAFWQTT